MKKLSTFAFLFILVSCSGVSSRIEKWTGMEFKNTHENKELFRYAWIKNVDPNYETGNLPVALNSPVIFQGMVFSGSNQGYMAAYDLYTGREMWRKSDKGFYHSQPAIYKDWLLYGTTEGRFYARDRFTGEIAYSVDLGSPVESQPVVSSGRVILHVRGHRLFCLDVETGKVLWAYKRSVPYLTTVQRVSTPVIDKGRVYVGFADGFVAALKLEDGVMLWDSKLSTGSKFVDVDMSPVIIGDKLVAGSLASPVNILDPGTGRILFTLDFNTSRKPIEIGESIVFGTTNGEVIFANKNFKTLKKISLGQGAVTSIQNWKNNLVVSTVKGKLIFIDNETFQEKRTIHLGHANSAVFGKMVTEDGHLVFMSSRNRIYALH